MSEGILDMFYSEWILITYNKQSDRKKRNLFSIKDICDQWHYCLIKGITCKEVKDEHKWSWWEKKKNNKMVSYKSFT